MSRSKQGGVSRNNQSYTYDQNTGLVKPADSNGTTFTYPS